MRLEATRDLIEEDPEEAAAAVGRLADLARDEIAEVRRLVEGLRPPALDQLGLVTALRQRAADHAVGVRPGGGRGLAWTVEADADVEPLPAAVEVAAYRIAMEAVTNAERHSDADACTVRLRRDDGVLQVLVRDTGSGLAATPGVGVGLTSMKERAEELGGSCTVTSGPGTGTVVEARLPARRVGGHMSGEPLRVLLVDDHEEFRAGLAALLAAADGCEVVGSAADGRTAVVMALDLQPDVVLMDLHMPQLNGIEATCAHRAVVTAHQRRRPDHDGGRRLGVRRRARRRPRLPAQGRPAPGDRARHRVGRRRAR